MDFAKVHLNYAELPILLGAKKHVPKIALLDLRVATTVSPIKLTTTVLDNLLSVQVFKSVHRYINVTSRSAAVYFASNESECGDFSSSAESIPWHFFFFGRM